MSEEKDSYWIPLADLMTVLMVIFLFMSVSYMIIVNEKQRDRDALIEDFQKSKIELLKELQKEFNEDFKSTKWNAILDSNDLSIKFIDETVLFDKNKSDIKDSFQHILSNFFPRYLNILLEKKYSDKIAEVRIEGHTSTEGDYIYNVKLSQDRTRNVLEFLLGLDYYKNLDEKDRELLQYWITANGLSFGRALDNGGQLTHQTKNPPDNLKCRRVEFRIVTTSDELIKKAIIKIKEK